MHGAGKRHHRFTKSPWKEAKPDGSLTTFRGTEKFGPRRTERRCWPCNARLLRAYWHAAVARLLKAQAAADEAAKEWPQAAQLSPDDSILSQAGRSGAGPETQGNGAATPDRKAPATARPYSVGDEITAPVPIKKPEPVFTEKARMAHYSGTVVLWLVVNSQGDIEQASVAKPLGLGLDQNALRTA